MQLHISPSLRHVTVLPGKGVREFIKVKVGSRRVSYRMVFYSLLFFTFLLRFVFVLTAVDTIDGETKCSTIGCLGKRLGPRILGGRHESPVPEVMYQILDEPASKDEIQGRDDIPQTLEEFTAEVKESRSDARAFAIKLRAMACSIQQHTKAAPLPCSKTSQRALNQCQRPPPAPLCRARPYLVDNSYFHFVLASDNILAASVVASSLIRNALRPHKVVLHIITDRKTYSPMQAWFSLHPLSPAIIEVKGLHHFDWFTKGKVPVLEAMEKDQRVRSQFRGGSSAIVANNTEKPYVIAAKLQALSPKYNSVMNHIRIHLPELFPSLNKIVFLDDDIVVQTDLTPLWDIDMEGKVNGAVETCRGDDKFVMSKRLKSYLNFSHPLIAKNFDPNECAWAYGMNIFDLEAWRKTNISRTYHSWLQENLKSDLSLWQLGTLPPGLIAFHGHVHVIDPFWHMLGLGYQDNTSLADAESAGVVHFNGRAKPWLEIAFPQLRPLWAKYVDFSDKFIKSCHIRASDDGID
ncbi:putative galacturonosyltransferase 12 [Vitis vinifera]|uniref:Hexosyltransferase n=1 Tax=Vitis vinifera TaxID=29760 RepID=A0A438IDG4_VITVI|nr:putative galacturonosyltransferase 12 [Vitis vinifera]